jgi:hypothetical protein
LKAVKDDDDDEEEEDEDGDSIFGGDPDREEFDGYHGNYAGDLEYWYHSALVVFWPMACDFDITLENKPSATITMMESIKPDQASTIEVINDYRRKLRSIISCLKHTPEKILSDTKTQTSTISRLLSLCLREEEAISILNIVNRKQLSHLSPILIRSLVSLQSRFPSTAFRDNFLALINREKSTVHVIAFVKALTNSYHPQTAAVAAAASQPAPLNDFEAAIFERIMKLSITSIDQAVGETIVQYLVAHNKVDWIEAFAKHLRNKLSINDQAWICNTIATTQAANPSYIGGMHRYLEEDGSRHVDEQRYQQHERRCFPAISKILCAIR